MGTPLKTALLATAALAAIGLAAGRALSAAQHGSRAVHTVDLTYGATAAQAAATLRRVTTPLGFVRSGCRAPSRRTDAICLQRRWSIPLTPAMVARLVASTGTSLEYASGQPTITCLKDRQRLSTRRPRLALEVCAAQATVGVEHLVLFTKSVVLATRGHARSTARVRGGQHGAAAGTVIEVVVFGHLLHEDHAA